MPEPIHGLIYTAKTASSVKLFGGWAFYVEFFAAAVYRPCVIPENVSNIPEGSFDTATEDHHHQHANPTGLREEEDREPSLPTHYTDNSMAPTCTARNRRRS